ncbi:ABC transporter permease [Chlorobium phaeovibrioides]|uniref:ABC transporter permease n=2 Tax=Chlorobium phaeovibrioides TaxID=1094 RepID=A0A5M8IDC9_CHLPH|nr:FtsX-like permease family protein [Chlorobium phaeovibrioides]KAA6233017.1 ABC transporter permease [Chlorobium phaeovibrioides]RTY35232.1 ABC transporter permease [Chlorobium phaeovibrioides]HCD36102.1 ABC transporter permease [Chlorobium sp.]
MDWMDHLRFAFVHLRERRRQTLLTALGVAVGSAMLITTISVARGSSANVISKVIDTSPHVLVKADRVTPLVPDNIVPQAGGQVSMVVKNVTPDDEVVIKSYTGVVEAIAGVSGVSRISPFVESRVIARNKTRFTPCVLKGVVPELEADIAGLRKNLLDPNAIEELGATPNGMIAGYLLAEKLHLRYRDRVVLVTKNGEEFSATLVGRFGSGFNVKDEREAIVNLALAQRMEGIASSSVSGIGLSTSRVERAAATAALVQSATGYKSESWDETNRNVIDFYNRNAAITLVLVGFVFVVAGLGVSSVMTTVVLQKVKDIAILRSMGVRASSITRIFMLEGLMIGILGVLFGSPIGHVICHAISTIRFEATTAGVLRADRINILESPDAHLIVALFGIVIAVISSISPARKATSYMPVSILRGEV